MKKILLLLIIGVITGFLIGKHLYEIPLTAGTCLDAGTKSLSQKFDAALKILKE